MESLVKAIKASKEVFMDFPMNAKTGSAIWLKIDKRYFLEQINACNDLAWEFEIVTQYGKSALYLTRKI
jgi:hypothetical protein